jgi:16S rRNA processing protein RimM
MDLLSVGIVKAPHGVRGEIMVRSFSGSTENWKRLREAQFGNRTVRRCLKIATQRPVHGGALMKLDGCDSREQAQAMVGSEVWVKREYACNLSAGEYYTADLCGCRVFFEDEPIGAVRSVMEAGPSQLLEIVTDDGRVHLIPFTDHFIGEVDPADGRISLREDCIVR